MNKYIMMTTIVLAFLLITGIAKSDEKTITPQEFATAVGEVPSKVGNHFKNEWQDIKEYQTNTWAEAKTKWPWNVLLKGKDATQD